MTKQTFNLDRQFIDWFYDEQYPDMGSNRSMVMDTPQALPGNVLWKDYWMRESFKAGAQAMWNEINGTLLQYATAVEGCEPELVEPCEVFDRARENLHYYVTQQLRLFP